jgi:hypothetical protein
VDSPEKQPGEERALAAVTAYGIAVEVTRNRPARSLEEAAAARGVRPDDIIKTLVVRRGEGDFLFVLVPGDRRFSWPKLRALLGTNRLSMPGPAVAKEVTGYERGTVTPDFSSLAAAVLDRSGHPAAAFALTYRGRLADDEQARLVESVQASVGELSRRIGRSRPTA